MGALPLPQLSGDPQVSFSSFQLSPVCKLQLPGCQHRGATPKQTSLSPVEQSASFLFDCGSANYPVLLTDNSTTTACEHKQMKSQNKVTLASSGMGREPVGLAGKPARTEAGQRRVGPQTANRRPLCGAAFWGHGPAKVTVLISLGSSA